MSTVAPAASSAATSTSTNTASSAPTENSSKTTSEPSTPKSESSVKPEAKEPKKQAGESLESNKETAEEKAERKEAERRKYKLKVNGKEQEREFTDEEIQRRLQTWEAAEERFTKASEVEAQMRNFVNALKENPYAVLEQLGLGEQLDQLSEKRLTSKVKKELMSPEERELEELREYRRQQEEAKLKSEEETKTKAEQERYREYQEKVSKFYDEKISEVLSQSDLPRTNYTVKRIAEVLYTALNKGYELDIPTAVDMVRDGYMTDIQSMFGDTPPEKLLKLLGNDIAKKIRKYDLEQLKSRQKSTQPAEQFSQIINQQNSSPSNSGESKKMNQHEWLESIRKKAGL